MNVLYVGRKAEAMIDAKSILRGALALAKVTELEAMILIQEIFEEEKGRP